MTTSGMTLAEPSARHSAPIELRDPERVDLDNPGPLTRFVQPMLNDPRDIVFVKVALAATLVALPFATVLFYLRTFPWWLGLAYLVAVTAQFQDRFILMLHCTSHRSLFKKKHQILNHWIPWVLGPFFGESPETYFTHHLGMHHLENNMRDDLSSTLRYKRDNLLHFLHYWARFFLFILLELPRYFFKKRRPKLAWRTIRGEGGFLVMIALLSLYSWQATLVVFVIPVVLVRFLMMAGNWAQHAFIDPARPSSSWVNSITCVNTRYNRRCFNDGYHISHHLKPARHWTDHPRDLRENLDAYRREGSIVFDGIDFFGVWLYLMLGRYDWLAKHYVNLDPSRDLSRDEIVQMLKSRTRPVMI